MVFGYRREYILKCFLNKSNHLFPNKNHYDMLNRQNNVSEVHKM